MKYSNTEIRDQRSEIRILKLISLFILLLLFVINIPSYSKEEELKLKAPIQESEPEENIPSQVDLSTIPNFPRLAISGRISENNSTIFLRP